MRFSESTASPDMNTFLEHIPRRIAGSMTTSDARLHRLFGFLIAGATVGYFWDVLAFLGFGVGSSAFPTKWLYSACAIGTLALLAQLLGILPRASAWIVYFSVAFTCVFTRPISDATDFETVAATFWVAILPLPRWREPTVSGFSRKVLAAWFLACSLTGTFLGWVSNSTGARAELRVGLAVIVALACWPSRSGVRKLGLIMTISLALWPLFVGVRSLRHLLVTFAFLILTWEPELSATLPAIEEPRNPRPFVWADAVGLMVALVTGVALFGGRSFQSEVARRVLSDVGLRIDQRYAERDLNGSWVLAAATNTASVPLERLQWPTRTRQLLTYLSDNPWHETQTPTRLLLRDHLERDLRARYCEKYPVPRLEIRYTGFDQTAVVGGVSCVGEFAAELRGKESGPAQGSRLRSEQ